MVRNKKFLIAVSFPL